MKAFLEKYADSFTLKDALKMVEHKLHKAKKYAEKGEDEEAYKCLATVYDMADDLIELKGLSIHDLKRM